MPWGMLPPCWLRRSRVPMVQLGTMNPQVLLTAVAALSQSKAQSGSLVALPDSTGL